VRPVHPSKREVYAVAGLDRVCYTDDRRLVEAWGEFLERFEWEGFWTLTFEKDFSFWSARKAFLRWTARFTLPEPRQPSYFGFTEYGHRCPRVPHIHCLTRNESVPRTQMWAYWFPHYGRARSEAYDSERGGRYYLAKYLTKEEHEVILDERKPDQYFMPGVESGQAVVSALSAHNQAAINARKEK